MRRPSGDPYHVLLTRFNQTGVRYVVVGMSGINYYAKKLSQMFGTMDFDLFLDPTLNNVKKALGGLEKLGFTIGTREGELGPVDQLAQGKLRQLVRNRVTFAGTTSEGLMVELLLQVSGYPFFELAKDAATFDAHGVPVRVGRLEKLLRSKKIAGRPKDLLFLRRYPFLKEEREQ